MSRDRLRKLVLGGAVAVLGAWIVLPRVWSGLGPTTAQAAPTEASVDEPNAAAAVPEGAPVEYVADLAEWVSAPWPDDPFRVTPTTAEDDQPKVDAASPAAYRPVLSAILSGATPQALIDGQVFKVGDRLADGSVIAAIEDLRVTLQGPQGPWLLELPE